MLASTFVTATRVRHHKKPLVNISVTRGFPV